MDSRPRPRRTAGRPVAPLRCDMSTYVAGAPDDDDEVIFLVRGPSTIADAPSQADQAPVEVPLQDDSPTFVLVRELGPGNCEADTFDDEAAARAAAKKKWASWVLFEQPSAFDVPLRELVSGGLGFGPGQA